MTLISPYKAVRLAEKLAPKIVEDQYNASREGRLEQRISDLFANTELSRLPSEEQHLLYRHADNYLVRQRETNKLLDVADTTFCDLASAMPRVGGIMLFCTISLGGIVYYTNGSFPNALAVSITGGPTLTLLYQILVEEPPRRFSPIRTVLHYLFSSQKKELRKLRREDRFQRELAEIYLMQKRGYSFSYSPEPNHSFSQG